jgi:AraC-like DNA-binding protein
MPRPSPSPFATLHGGDEEIITSATYTWSNRRGNPHEAVIQQTLAGEAYFEDARQRRLVPAGHAMLFTHDEATHYGYPPDATTPYRQRYLSFQLAALRPWFDRLREKFSPIVLMSTKGEASTLFTEIARRFRARSFRDRFQETELLHQLLIALHREQVNATQTQDPIEYGRHYLEDNFRSPLNLKQVADTCGISREHFIRSFHARYGEPPGELLRRLRLEHAARMLRATQLPLQEVALACGFADANTFCRAYRLRYGVTPGSTRAASL